MANFLDHLTPKLIDFVQAQQMFFVATSLKDGRINLSPKGMDTLRVLDEKSLAYLDLTGSGNETATHLRHDPNQRITVMFCSFDEKPMILRIYGQGEAIRPRDAQWSELASHFPKFPTTRQIIRITVSSIQTSCGFGVPIFTLAGHRSQMQEWAEKVGDAGIQRYWADKNRSSIDGLDTGLLP